MKYRSLLLPLVAVFALAITSCKKDGDLAPVVTLQAGLNVINAGTDTINFFQNGTRLNNASAYFPGGTLGYLPVNAGEQSYQIKKAGTPTVLSDTKYTLKDSTYNSLFIAGSTADKMFLTRDTIYSDTTSVRFINASPEASYDVKIGSTFAYTNRVFKSVTPFMLMPDGTKVLTVTQAGGTTPLVTRNISLAKGRVYTVYTRGKPGGTGTNAFAATLITNY